MLCELKEKALINHVLVGPPFNEPIEKIPMSLA